MPATERAQRRISFKGWMPERSRPVWSRTTHASQKTGFLRNVATALVVSTYHPPYAAPEQSGNFPPRSSAHSSCRLGIDCDGPHANRRVLSHAYKQVRPAERLERSRHSKTGCRCVRLKRLKPHAGHSMRLQEKHRTKPAIIPIVASIVPNRRRHFNRSRRSRQGQCVNQPDSKSAISDKNFRSGGLFANSP